MRLYKSRIVVQFIFGILFGQTLFAGSYGGGNGGGGIVCRDPVSGQETVQLIDIWEHARPGAEVAIPVRESNLDSHTQINQAVRGLNHWVSWGDIIEPLLDEIRHVNEELSDARNSMSDTDALEYPFEIFPAVRPNHCRFEVIASYQANGRILYNSRLLEALKRNPTHYAGLVLHEAFYRLARDHHDATDSSDVRELVARTLSGEFEQMQSIRADGLGPRVLSTRNESIWLANQVLGMPAQSLRQGECIGPSTMCTQLAEYATWRWRIPHVMSSREARVRLYLAAAMDGGSVQCAVEPKLYSHNGVLVRELGRQNVVLNGGTAQVAQRRWADLELDLRGVHGNTFGALKRERYSLRIELSCDHIDRLEMSYVGFLRNDVRSVTSQRLASSSSQLLRGYTLARGVNSFELR